METIGERIRRTRQRDVLTQAELAEAAGVSLITINRIENNAIDSPRPATVRRIAQALGVEPAWLLFGDEELKIAA